MSTRDGEVQGLARRVVERAGYFCELPLSATLLCTLTVPLVASTLGCRQAMPLPHKLRLCGSRQKRIEDGVRLLRIPPCCLPLWLEGVSGVIAGGARVRVVVLVRLLLLGCFTVHCGAGHLGYRNACHTLTDGSRLGCSVIVLPGTFCHTSDTVAQWSSRLSRPNVLGSCPRIDPANSKCSC